MPLPEKMIEWPEYADDLFVVEFYARILQCKPEEVVEASNFLKLDDNEEYWSLSDLKNIPVEFVMEMNDCRVKDFYIGYIVIFETNGTLIIADQNASPFVFWMKKQ